MARRKYKFWGSVCLGNGLTRPIRAESAKELAEKARTARAEGFTVETFIGTKLVAL